MHIQDFCVIVSSEFCGDIDSLELGDMVEYSLSKGKGSKVSAEKVNKTHAGEVPSFFAFCFKQIVWGDKGSFYSGGNICLLLLFSFY